MRCLLALTLSVLLGSAAVRAQAPTELKGHTALVYSVAFSPDGQLLGSGSADKTVRLWNPADGKEVKNLGTHGNSVYSVAFSPDGKWLASAGADGVIKLWDLAAQKEAKSIKGHEGAAIT